VVRLRCMCSGIEMHESGRPRSTSCQPLNFTYVSVHLPVSPDDSFALTMTLLTQVYAVRWLLLVVAFVAYVANQYRKNRRLQAFRGPFSTGWSELWHIRAILGGYSHEAYKTVNDKYGEFSGVV
jgi:hypothetical protein